MTTDAVVPTGVERSFGNDEFIVSKTDLTGRITYVNDVFLRVSQYEEDELLGRPHSLIRHPDMPRAVFALLWSEIAAGREISAYVVNLAKDGAHYWVLAHVAPTVVAGRTVAYHSNRRVPDAAALATIEPLYSALVTEERRHSRVSEAVAASTRILESELAARSMNYDEFVWSITGVAA
jgi:PAS domain S-box-containing protein